MPDSATLTVLLLEDGAAERALLRGFLEDEVKDPRIEVMETENGREGLKLIEACSVDCIVLDAELPDMTVRTFLENMFSKNLLWQPPVIVLAAQGQEELAVDVMRAGATDYVIRTKESGHLKLLPFLIKRAYQERLTRYEKRQMDEAFWVSVRSRDALMEVMEEGVIGIDEEGSILFANPASGQLMGVQVSALINRDLLTVLNEYGHEPSNPWTVADILEGLQQGEVKEGHFTLAPAALDGVQVTQKMEKVHFAARPVQDGHGQFAGGVIVLRPLS